MQDQTEKDHTTMKGKAGRKAKKKKTGPISKGGIAAMKKPTGVSGGFLNFKKLYGSM